MTLSFYRKGRTSIYASRFDQRFSYCCYIPESYDEYGSESYPLTVLIHGSKRNADVLRDQFAGFAEETQSVILAPLFPAGIIDPNDLHNYKYIAYGDIRFDEILLNMIQEISEIYRIRSERFLLHGFSGGAQFAHRFFYLHPERLLGVSVAAPGTVSLPDDRKQWWIGTGNISSLFSIDFTVEALRPVPVQLVIGEDDVETWDVTVSEKSSHYMPGANDAGANRIDRLRSLKSALENAGVSVCLDLVPQASHEGAKLQPPVWRFFSEILENQSTAYSGAPS